MKNSAPKQLQSSGSNKIQVQLSTRHESRNRYRDLLRWEAVTTLLLHLQYLAVGKHSACPGLLPADQPLVLWTCGGHFDFLAPQNIPQSNPLTPHHNTVSKIRTAIKPTWPTSKCKTVSNNKKGVGGGLNTHQCHPKHTVHNLSNVCSNHTTFTL